MAERIEQIEEMHQVRTPFDHLKTSINGYTLRDAYLLGLKHSQKGSQTKQGG